MGLIPNRMGSGEMAFEISSKTDLQEDRQGENWSTSAKLSIF